MTADASWPAGLRDLFARTYGPAWPVEKFDRRRWQEALSLPSRAPIVVLGSSDETAR